MASNNTINNYHYITYLRYIYADVTDIIVKSFLGEHFLELNLTE